MLRKCGRKFRRRDERTTNLDVFTDDVLPAGDARRDGGGREELDGVAERRLGADLAQHVQGVVVNLPRRREDQIVGYGSSDLRYL